MAKLSSGLTRIIVGVVVVAIVAGGAYFAFFRGSSDKSVTGEFQSAVGVYPGTPVKILGVNVGTVSSVKPNGSAVTIKISYDSKYKLPANVYGVLVANSLVSDRYVQLQPAYKSGPVLKNNGKIMSGHTAAPAELDDIYAALNTLSVALGPAGANKGGKKDGALSALVNVAAANLKGNGAALGTSISKLSKAAQTLAGSRGDLFQTVSNLRKFTDTLTASDKQVRLFNEQLAQVAGDLASERTDLGLALHDLGLALDDVSNFVKHNAKKFHTSITGLETITNILVKEKSSLNETLAVAPVALANIVHAYQPDLGVIATRGNLVSLTDLKPTTVCAILYSAVKGSPAGNILGKLTDDINNGCTNLLSGQAKKLGKTLTQLVNDLLPSLKGNVGGLLGGGLGGLIGTGGGS